MLQLLDYAQTKILTKSSTKQAHYQSRLKPRNYRLVPKVKYNVFCLLTLVAPKAANDKRSGHLRLRFSNCLPNSATRSFTGSQT